MRALLTRVAEGGGAGVMAESAPIHTRVHRLLCSEVARLGLSLPIESIVIYVRHLGDNINYMPDTTSIYARRLEDSDG